MPGARILRSRASGSATPLRPSAWSFSHHARARDSCSRRLGAKLSVTSRPDPWSSCLPHDDRAVIEIQILTRSCKPSLRSACPFHTEAGRTNDARLPENRGCEPLHPGSAPPASAATAEVFRSPEAVADPCTAPCRRRTARPPMPDDAWRPKPCARSPARTEMPRLRCCPRLPGDAHRGNG